MHVDRFVPAPDLVARRYPGSPERYAYRFSRRFIMAWSNIENRLDANGE
jgi:hypothetical protein